MHHIIQYLIHSSPSQLLLYSALLFICWNIENVAGVIFNYRKWKHALVNAVFIITNIPGQYLMGLAFAMTMRWTAGNHFGFLFHFPFKHSVLATFFITFIFLDFGEYVYHVLMHKIKRLWMFHVVHHSDPVVDISTTLREHPGENFIRLSFTLFWVFLSGAAFWALLVRQIIQMFTTLFAHINYRLPERVDAVIGLVFITPNLHQVHHHSRQPYTDCNYGDVLSIWDHLFRTFKKLPAGDLIFGVDTYMREEDTNTFISVLKIPFGKYRKNK